MHCDKTNPFLLLLYYKNDIKLVSASNTNLIWLLQRETYYNATMVRLSMCFTTWETLKICYLSQCVKFQTKYAKQ